MYKALLLPNSFKLIGWIILIPATIFGIIIIITNYEAQWLEANVFAVFTDQIFGNSKAFSFVETNITNTVAGAAFIIGGMLVGFSKEKKEDEYIANIRLSSLLWAVYVNYILLFLAFIFVYGTSFFSVMIFNMFTVLIIFIVRFNYILYKTSKSGSDEK